MPNGKECGSPLVTVDYSSGSGARGGQRFCQIYYLECEKYREKHGQYIRKKIWGVAGGRSSSGAKVWEEFTWNLPNEERFSTNEDVNELMEKAKISMGLGEFGGAMEYYDKIIEKESTLVEAWLSKGICLARLGRLGEAIECYDEVTRMDPNSAVAWLSKWLALDRIGRQEEAGRCYDRAVKIDPEFVKEIQDSIRRSAEKADMKRTTKKA